jgi:hypothetical protein
MRFSMPQYIARMIRFLLPALAISLSAGAHELRDMKLVGSHGLQGRGAYQPVIHPQGARWIAYVGHHVGRAVNPLTGAMEENGTSILDVTDPREPRLLAHIPSQGGAQMARVCGGASLPAADKSRTYLLRTRGDVAHEIWDVSNPAAPAQLVTVASGLSGTHKSWWECDSGIAYLVSGVPGWRTHRMTQVFDLSDPSKPRFIRDFGLAGQEPGSRGEVPTGLHGPISTGPRGNRVYFGYGTNADGVLQIVDREKLLKGPRAPTAANLAYPQVGRLDLPPSLGAHTTFPILGMEVAEFARDRGGARRDMVLIVNEALSSHCGEARQMVWLADVTAEHRPMTVSGWTVPEASGSFCARGRFGAHSSNESFAPVYYRRLVFIAFFNAGVRALDIRDPYRPVEVAFFIPAGKPLTNNVEVDERGYIYAVDRAGLGMHVLELAGEARKVANWGAARASNPVHERGAAP